MLYIIPAWYQENTWNENEQIWYMRHMHSEADDTVKQIQLLHRKAGLPYRIILLNYAPNLRHFLHRQGVYRAPYWSVFDAIQEAKGTSAAVLFFRDLTWPENIEFVYTPFAVVAKRNNEKFAQIEFGEDGNMIHVDAYKKDAVATHYVYDDRGFISSMTVYENGVPVFTDYLTQSGIPKMRHYLADDHVEINKNRAFYKLTPGDEGEKYDFKSTRYDSMEDVITEVLGTYIETTDREDVFCEAVHERHSRMLGEVLKGRKYVLSFFGDRYQVEKHPECQERLAGAGYIVVDEAMHMKRIIDSFGPKLKRIVDISPFDTRIDSGISEQLAIKNILIPIDGLSNELFEKTVGIILNYYETHPQIRAHLFTRKPDYERISVIKDQITLFLKHRGYDAGSSGNEISCVKDNRMDIVQVRDRLFLVDQCVTELEISRCLREQRIIVDLRGGMDLYLQVSAVSMGIPVIAISESPFVEDKMNGCIIDGAEDLEKALDHFLKGLVNWNNAHIQSYEIAKRYTTDVLVDKWKGVMDTLARD